MDPSTLDGPASGEAQRLDALWREHGRRVLAYALRHTDPDAAQDVLSDTFLVAWRRISEVPPEPLPWLLVVARNTLANQARSAARRDRLRDELARLHAVSQPLHGADDTAAERQEVLAALAAMSPTEREALLLVAWDGLSPAEAAQVAGCTTSTFHVRLFRARRRLRDRESASRGASATALTANGSPA